MDQAAMNRCLACTARQRLARTVYAGARWSLLLARNGERMDRLAARLPIALAFAWILVSSLTCDTVAAGVLLGNEVLASHQFRELRGKRIGLITNPSGVNRRKESTIDVLRRAPGVKLVALFGPEHGVYGDVKAGDNIASSRDARTGLPVHSLYGATRKPTPAMLEGLDAVVYDLQDTGCRSYTFISTMGLAMEASAEAGVEFIVLDRPNPLGGVRVEGPSVDERYRSFVSQWNTPYLYGLTCGELALMINGEGWIKKPCRLTVVPLQGWRRSMVWRDTSLPWIPTSPNIPRSDSPLYCAATGLFGEVAGGSGVSIGTRIGRPFECVMATWLDGPRFAGKLNGYRLNGVRFDAMETTLNGKPYQGVELNFTAPATAPLAALNLYLHDAIRSLTGRNLLAEAVKDGRNFQIFDKIVGNGSTRKALLEGKSATDIIKSWHRVETEFRRQRKPYLLYP